MVEQNALRHVGISAIGRKQMRGKMTSEGDAGFPFLFAICLGRQLCRTGDCY